MKMKSTKEKFNELRLSCFVFSGFICIINSYLLSEDMTAAQTPLNSQKGFGLQAKHSQSSFSASLIQ